MGMMQRQLIVKALIEIQPCARYFPTKKVRRSGRRSIVSQYMPAWTALYTKVLMKNISEVNFMNDVDLFESIKQSFKNEIDREFTEQKEKLLKQLDDELERKRSEIILNAVNQIKFTCAMQNIPFPQINVMIEIKQ